jgi:hypothetical protein
VYTLSAMAGQRAAEGNIHSTWSIGSPTLMRHVTCEGASCGSSCVGLQAAGPSLHSAMPAVAHIT